MIKFSKNLSCEQQLQVLKNKLAKGIIKVCFDPRESIMLAELRFSTACLTVGKFLAMVMGPYLECWTNRKTKPLWERMNQPCLLVMTDWPYYILILVEEGEFMIHLSVPFSSCQSAFFSLYIFHSPVKPCYVVLFCFQFQIKSTCIQLFRCGYVYFT